MLSCHVYCICYVTIAFIPHDENEYSRVPLAFNEKTEILFTFELKIHWGLLLAMCCVCLSWCICTCCADLICVATAAAAVFVWGMDVRCALANATPLSPKKSTKELTRPGMGECRTAQFKSSANLRVDILPFRFFSSLNSMSVATHVSLVRIVRYLHFAIAISSKIIQQLSESYLKN